MCRHPTKQIVACSHTDHLAEIFSNRVKSDIQEHGSMLGIKLAKDTSAASRWALSSRGTYIAKGAGSAVTGLRADLVIIDDPVAGYEKAYSQLERDKLWNWYANDLETRLHPQCPLVVVMTWWHLDDIGGRIMQRNHDGIEHWEILRIPAESEGIDVDPLGRPKGALLWANDPNHRYAEDLKKFKLTKSARDWAALYQCNPLALGSGMFTENNFRWSDNPPNREDMKIFIGADFATSQGKGDYTCFVVIGIDRRGSWHALQMYHRQVTPDIWADDLSRLCYQWKPVSAVCVEGGSIWNSVEPILKAFCRARQIMPNFKKYTRTKKKEETALALQGLLNDRPMFLPRGRAWANEILSQCLAFPLAGGRGHDDIVDALANAANQIPLMTPKIKPLDEVVLPPLPNGCIRFFDPILDDPNGQGILLGPMHDRWTNPEPRPSMSLIQPRRSRTPYRNQRI
jgi:predicted phage terminase large subunit-like protein